MGSKKDHKHRKEHKHKHHRKHRRSDSEERSPVAKRKYESLEESEAHSSSKKHRGPEKHKRERHRRDHDDSPQEEKRSLKREEVEVIEEEEEVYVPPATKQSNDAEIGDHAEGQSLSIEETNRVRAKLGLKPLEVNSTPGGENGKKLGRSDEDSFHAPATDLWKQKKEKEMREKLQASRDKRKMKQKLSTIKTLGEEEEEESAASWVVRSREHQDKIKKEKQLAAIGDQFGVGKLVQKELGKTIKKDPDYSEKDLKGLNVEHSLESFVDGRSAILVIKDKDILASDEEDVLHSVNVDDIEKAKKNLDIKRRGTGYKAYEEEEVDELGFFKAKSTLGKYDEEIEGEKKNRFTIGNQGAVDTSWEQQKIQMRQEIRAKGETLKLPALKIASEYLTEEEMKFKKRKRKVKKVRKRETLKADDLVPLPGETTGIDHGSRSKSEKIPGLDIEDGTSKTKYDEAMEVEEDNQVIADDEDVVDELQRALEKTRRAKQKQVQAADDTVALKVAQQLETLSQANLEKPQDQYSNTLFLNATDEFCRQLGNPVKNASITQEQDMEIESDHEEEDEMQTSAWNTVDPDKEEVPEKPVTSHEIEDHAPIEAEPLAANGLLGALKLATRKGYLSDEKVKKGNLIVTTNKNSSLYSKNYAIEDKNAVDYLDKYANEKYTKDRSRYDRGMVSEFTEKSDYKPKIAIEYVDDHGKNMSAKEAFRTLSHRFHGKGSGKSKLEKRMKKAKEEETMKHMSSTDTPLNTVAMMKEKLRSESSPYIVLSGAGKTLMAGGSLSKTK